MSTGLRSQTPQGALTHVLEVLNNQAFNLIFEEAGISTIYDFLAIEPRDLKDVSAINDDAQVIHLNVVQIGKIRKIHDWYKKQEVSSVGVWYTLNEDTLNTYLAESPHQDNSLNKPPIDSMSVNTTPSTSHTEMLYGVKRNITDYPRLREDKMWMSFQHSFTATP